MVIGRDIYGFNRSIGVDLIDVRAAVERRLELQLSEHDNSEWGEYFSCDQSVGPIRQVSVFVNYEGPEEYGDVYPDYSPLILVRCDRRVVADTVCSKLLTIPDLVVLERFGARRREFAPDDRHNLVRLELAVSDAACGERRSRISIDLPYCDLMSIINLDPDDDLVGMLDLSAGQVDRLAQSAGALVPDSANCAYAVDLDTVTLIP
jgi:hypothetical protein